jgi:hypothetical protein
MACNKFSGLFGVVAEREKSFITRTKNFFSLSLVIPTNKLECLSLSRLFILLFVRKPGANLPIIVLPRLRTNALAYSLEESVRKKKV